MARSFTEREKERIRKSLQEACKKSWTQYGYKKTSIDVYDNYWYLFELQPYQDTLEGRNDYCGWITKGDALSFDIALNLGTEQNRLYSRFVVAVYDGEKYTQVSNTAYSI